MRSASLMKHSVRIAGHATSVSLEPAFWEGLCEIAARRHVSVNALLSEIDAERGGNLSSAIRLFVLEGCRRGELGVSDPPGPPPRRYAGLRGSPTRTILNPNRKPAGERGSG